MEKRFQVFISSTYADLADERAEVVSMLLNLDALPAGMELFPATNDDAWTLIKRVIDESDYYLLVIGGRYGSVDDETDLSYTEKEFDYAVEQKKPVMAFLHGDPGKIPAGKTDQKDVFRHKLDAFRGKVQNVVHVNFWTETNELAGLVAKSFTKIQKSHPAIGWVRGDVQTAGDALAEINELRKQLDAANRRIATSKEQPPPGTDEFAQGASKLEISIPGESETQYERTLEWAPWTGHTDVEVSWDELFAAVGPSLLDEVEQVVLRRNLDKWLLVKFGAQWRGEVKEAAAAKGHVVKRSRRTKLALRDEDFETILIQLRALGLVHRGERKRPVADKGTYWTLTPFGDTHLTSLRAIRRDRLDDPSSLRRDGTGSESVEEAA